MNQHASQVAGAKPRQPLPYFFRLFLLTASLVLAALLTVACAPSAAPTKAAARAAGKPVIVVTYSALGSLVQDLVGDQATVSVSIPNGLDPHEWEPSAQDIARLNHADLVVRNGLGLEAGMEKALAGLAKSGVRVFVAADHIAVRHVKAGEGLPGGDADQAAGAADPHLWLSPAAVKSLLVALSARLDQELGLRTAPRLGDLLGRVDALDSRIRARVAALPQADRLLVTGHESMGYFAESFGLTLVGAIVPGLSSQSQVSAAGLAGLKASIRGRQVRVIFTELGTPPKVAESLAREMGIRAVPIGTHGLPAGGTWFDLMNQLADSVVGNLAAGASPQ